MNTPNPVPDQTQKGWAPSGSTWASSLGGSVSIVVLAVLDALHVPISATLAGAISAICAVAVGYLPPSGRR